ncbi:MAG TPA: RsmE family RNA methyltransferase [Rhabdochlamydiaceae bacterium]|jgi:16S rRNA (uracil1498-N3)-methyltransferase|nr:RsmE family RNA methyltransferase [Rhabdochlamydiaceae bacterium]
MPANRFFIAAPLNNTLILEGEEIHHFKVMRIRPGEAIEIVNGQGEIAVAEVTSLTNKQCELKIVSHQKAPPPKQTVILALALTRPASLEWTFEKATELGATHFWLFPGKQSEKKELPPSQLRRLETIMISALKQCGRLYLPHITLKPALEQWPPPPGSLFFGDLSAKAPLKGPFEKTVTFFIGPEKGFSSTEIHILKEKFKAHPICLHEHILRAETAAITILSQFSLLKMS